MTIETRRFAGTACALILATTLASAEAGANSMDDKPISSGDPGSAADRSHRIGVTGSVRSPGGAPVAGAMIAARSLDVPSLPIPEIAILSDATGRYVWPLRPGRYQLTPMLNGTSGTPGVVEVGPGELATLDLIIAP